MTGHPYNAPFILKDGTVAVAWPDGTLRNPKTGEALKDNPASTCVHQFGPWVYHHNGGNPGYENNHRECEICGFCERVYL